MIYSLSLFAIISYCLAAIYQSTHLFGSKSINRSALIMTCGLGVIAHCSTLINLFHTPTGFDFSLFRAASLVSLFIIVLTLTSTLRRPMDNLLIALCPLAAIGVALALIDSQSKSLSSPLTGGMLLHILSSILAYSVFSMAFVQALVLYIQEKQLKMHHLNGIIQRLPPLQTMEKMLFELIWIGMVLLSLSIISGIIFIDDIFAQHLSHKTVFSVLAWLIFAVLLWGRHHQGWRSYTVIKWTIGGFVLLMMGYFGSKIVLELILSNKP